MADDKSQVGEPDRSFVAKGEGYELDTFAQKHGISRDEVRDLVDKHGNDRDALEKAAERMKS